MTRIMWVADEHRDTKDSVSRGTPVLGWLEQKNRKCKNTIILIMKFFKGPIGQRAILSHFDLLVNFSKLISKQQRRLQEETKILYEKKKKPKDRGDNSNHETA